jgi:hypothetical protein
MRSGIKWFVAAGLVVGLALAVFVSPFASSSPDGLEQVSVQQGFDAAGTPHHAADSPLADYSVRGIHPNRMSTAVAGAVGTLVTFGLGLGMFGLVRLRRTRAARSGPTPVGV